MEQLPNKMEGEDKIKQENYEFSLERNYVDNLDRVDRRDRRGEIISAVPSWSYRHGYDRINWNNK